MTESQRLAWELISRLAVGDRDGFTAAWNGAGDRQRGQIGLVLTEGTRISRMLAAMQTGQAAPFRMADIPDGLCEEANGFLRDYHRGGAPGGRWPGCDCGADVAAAVGELYLRQGEALGFSRGEQAGLIGRVLAVVAGKDDGHNPLWDRRHFQDHTYITDVATAQQHREHREAAGQPGQPDPAAMLP